MSTRKSIHTTGEHTIDNIIRSEYGNDLSPEEHKAKKEEIAVLNPHIVSLESLRVGDQVFLEDEPEGQEEDTSSELSGESGELSGESGELSGDPDLSTLESGQFNTEDQAVHTIHLPATDKKKKKHD